MRATTARTAALALVLALTAACGTTVTGAGSAAAPGTAGAGLGAPPARPGAAGGSTVGGTIGTTPGAAVNGGSASGGGTSSAAGPSVNGTTSSGNGVASTQLQNGPGVTATTVTLGITYYQSAKQANEAFGAKGVDFGDPVAGSKVLINDINARGGIAGRKVVPLFYAIDPQSSSPYAALAQAECTYFTEDHKVLAVIDGAPAADARACLDKRGVAVLTGKLVTSDLTPNEVDAYTVRLDRLFAALVPALQAQGWFSPWNSATASPGATRAKTGIVTVDDAQTNRAVDGVLIPGLKRAGYAPDPSDVIRIAPPGGFSDDGAVVAAIDAAVLKLNAHGVDHVILTDGNGSLSLLFNNYAYSQNYFPRYGGSSGNAWQILLTGGSLQAKTLNGAMGVGWQPLFDLPYTNHGTGPGNSPTRQRCFSLFTKAGTPQSGADVAGAQAEGCDVAFLLPTLLTGYRGALNLQTIVQRVDGLGTTYRQASGLGSRFGSGQHDGAGAYAYLQFNSTCSCFSYVGKPQPMPR